MLATMKLLFCSKRLLKDSVLVRGHKKLSTLRFRCIVDPVKVIVKMKTSNEIKACFPPSDRKSKATYAGEWPTRPDTEDKKANWYRNQHRRRNSQYSSHLSDSETPQPACPAGSVASWVRFSFSPTERANRMGSGSTHYGTHARSHQRATGDKPHSLGVAGESSQRQRFLQQSVGLNAEDPGARHSEHPHEHFNHPASETHFIPSPIIPGPRQVVYSSLAADAASRNHLNAEEYTYPHSPRGPQHRLGFQWNQRLPEAQQAEVYVYLVSPPPPSPEHNPEQSAHPFSTSQGSSGKDMLTNRISFAQNRGISSHGPAGQGSSENHKQRKSIWERKHQRKSLQATSDYEKLAGSSGGTSLVHHEPFSHNPSLLPERGRVGVDAVPPTISS